MLCEWKNCEVVELNVQSDHVHLLVSVLPKDFNFEFKGNTKG